MSVIVNLKDVVKNYGKDQVVTRALRGVTLSLEKGEFTAMAGPSGSGKSTLLNLIGGLDHPTSGLVEVANHDLTGMSSTELSHLRRDRIGFIFQAYNLIPVLTAMENAEYVLVLQGTPADERRERVRLILSEVGLAGLEDRYPPATVRRPAAAGGHCPGHGSGAGPDPGGRTHGQCGLPDRQIAPGTDAAAQ